MRGAIGPIIDGFAKQRAFIDDVIHAVQVDLGKQGAAAVLADHPVIESLGLPARQHIADIKDHRLGLRHLALSF